MINSYISANVNLKIWTSVVRGVTFWNWIIACRAVRWKLDVSGRCTCKHDFFGWRRQIWCKVQKHSSCPSSKNCQCCHDDAWNASNVWSVKQGSYEVVTCRTNTTFLSVSMQFNRLAPVCVRLTFGYGPLKWSFASTRGPRPQDLIKLQQEEFQ